MANTTGTRDIFVEANGLRHHLVARGSPGAPIVMMVHGLTQQARVFDGIATKLAAKYHVYALDVRGRGESEWGPPDGYQMANYVADLEAVLAALGIEPFALVGTSMGGLVAMQYTAKFSAHVTKIVFNDIGPEINPEGGARIMKMLTGAQEAFTDLKAVVRYYREENGPVLANRSDDEVLDYARWHVRKTDTGVYTWKMDPAVRVPNTTPPPMAPWEAFNAITCPVLVVRGAVSDILAGETAEKMVESTSTGHYAEVPGVGHAPSLAEPAAVKALEAFLA